MNREFLITKFACATCGNKLELATGAAPNGNWRSHSEGEPTGAAMVQQVVAVVPCRTCTEPAREVTRAVTMLMKHAGLATGEAA